MIAIPIIPGRVYRVMHRGLSLIVIAPDGCTALVIALPRFCDDAAPESIGAIPCAA